MYQQINDRNAQGPLQGDAVAAHEEQVRTIFEILNGRAEADLLLKNLNILDVHSESVYSGSILVHDKRIIGLNPDETILKVREVFDGQGLYAIPGLIDAHVHFEAQLAHPVAFGEAIVPCGTTTMVRSGAAALR